MQTPKQPQTVERNSMLGIVDKFLDWNFNHRATVSFEWYREHVQKFVSAHRGLEIENLRPNHIEQCSVNRQPERQILGETCCVRLNAVSPRRCNKASFLLTQLHSWKSQTRQLEMFPSRPMSWNNYCSYFWSKNCWSFSCYLRDWMSSAGITSFRSKTMI